jgi:uncharacterized protein (TIGR02001 family)
MHHRTLKLVLSLSLAFTAAGTLARAQGVSTTITPSVVSQYMFRGVRLGGPALQPSVEVASGNLGVGVWVSTPLKDKVVGQSDPEIDPYAYYTVALEDNLSVVPGFTWYTYTNADTKAGFYKSTFEPSLAINYTVSGVKLTPKFYYDMVVKGPTYEFAASYTVPVKDINSEVGLTATIGTYTWNEAVKDSAPSTKNKGDYFILGAAMPFELIKGQKLVLGASWSKGSSNYYQTGTGPKITNTAAVSRIFATVSYIVSF